MILSSAFRLILPALLALGAAGGASRAAATPLPSDVSVHLAAAPSVGLLPGEPFTLTLEVVNEGVLPVPRVNIHSAPLYPYEVDLSQQTVDCEPMILGIDDTPVGYYYTETWYIGIDPSPPLQAGEHRICHITMALAADAPPVVHLSFGMSGLFSDPDPSNDVGTVTLYRAQATLPVPADSLVAATLLALCLAALGAWRCHAYSPRRV
jgi:hypothetical protein